MGAHGYGALTGQPGEQGRGRPRQPWFRSTLAVSAAVAQGCRRTSVQPYLGVGAGAGKRKCRVELGSEVGEGDFGVG
jgi:hypothetical protein